MHTHRHHKRHTTALALCSVPPTERFNPFVLVLRTSTPLTFTLNHPPTQRTKAKMRIALPLTFLLGSLTSAYAADVKLVNPPKELKVCVYVYVCVCVFMCV